jgi:hypothetical protein
MFPILDTNLWPSRSPVGAGSGSGGAGVGLPPDTKQPQLLLMRVSSVKSSRSSHDNESSNNNKRGTGGNQGSQQHKGPFTNYVDILILQRPHFVHRKVPPSTICASLIKKSIFFSKGHST